jgi:hypothetical protein
MYSYALLEKGYYYLIQELADSPINLIRITVETDHCVYVSTFGNEETMEWKKKSDQVFDIIELLSDKVVKDWEEVYNQDAYNYEEGEE